MQDKDGNITQTSNFTLQFYFDTLTQLLKEPRKFFSGLSPEIGWKTPGCFLSASSIIYAIASAMNGTYPNPFFMGVIFFINAVGMVLITAFLGYTVMMVTIGKRLTFISFFAIYAFASGVTLIASWMSFFLIITEPWKFWIIGTGLVKFGKFTVKEAILIILLSVGLIILFLYSILLLFPNLSL